MVEPISDAELKVVGFLDYVATEALVKGGDPPEGKPILAMMVARIEADAAALADRDARIATLTAALAAAEARAMPEARRIVEPTDADDIREGVYLRSTGWENLPWRVCVAYRNETDNNRIWWLDGGDSYPAAWSGLAGITLIGPLPLPTLSQAEGR